MKMWCSLVPTVTEVVDTRVFYFYLCWVPHSLCDLNSIQDWTWVPVGKNVEKPTTETTRNSPTQSCFKDWFNSFNTRRMQMYLMPLLQIAKQCYVTHIFNYNSKQKTPSPWLDQGSFCLLEGHRYMENQAAIQNIFLRKVNKNYKC